MGVMLKPVLFLCVLISLIFTTSAQSCRSYTFRSNRLFSTCNDLPVLSSFLHWTYTPSNRTVSLAFRKTGVTSSNWISWAINPTGQGMLGAQALVAFQTDGRMRAYTSPVTSYTTTLAEGPLSFTVRDLTAEFSGSEMTIYATVVLPSGSTTVNQVWQEGPLAGTSPGRHLTTGPNVQSRGTIDFLSGQSASNGGGANSRVKRRNIHGVLNAVGWGTLMPLGAIIARYLKVARSADPAWFYLHIAVQISGYSIGVGGWATGLKLGSESAGVQYNAHRNIGIALFVLGTLQVFALLLRPKPDHKYRIYWKVYHQMTGYVVIILSVINIYKGFNMLKPDNKWKRTYTGVIIALACIAVILEAFTWMVVMKRKKNEKSHPGTNGVNGYGAGHHGQGV